MQRHCLSKVVKTLLVRFHGDLQQHTVRQHLFEKNNTTTPFYQLRGISSNFLKADSIVSK